MILENFIVFEGIDGTGTTSQLRLLKERFESKEDGSEAVFTQEPTASPIGTLIRSALQSSYKLNPKTMARLFATDRCEHLYGDNGIIENLKLGKVVFTDRYLFSSLAYQSVTGVGETAITQNEEFPLPQILFFFDLPVEISMERVNERSNVLEIYEEESFQEKVQKEYHLLLKKYQDLEPNMQIIHIDASQPIEKIHTKIWSIVQNLPK